VSLGYALACAFLQLAVAFFKACLFVTFGFDFLNFASYVFMKAFLNFAGSYKWPTCFLEGKKSTCDAEIEMPLKKRQSTK
jgi:hypothetical protein